MSRDRPYTRVIRDGDKLIFKKDKRFKVSTEVTEIEEKMKFLFFHQLATRANVIEYNILEAKWKKLTKYSVNP
jgi:hypothetical protein